MASIELWSCKDLIMDSDISNASQMVAYRTPLPIIQEERRVRHANCLGRQIDIHPHTDGRTDKLTNRNMDVRTAEQLQKLSKWIKSQYKQIYNDAENEVNCYVSQLIFLSPLHPRCYASTIL